MKRTGVRARLGRAFALQIAAISAGVIVGVFGITFIVSDVLSREALQGEATHFWKRLAENPAQALPDTDNMTGYLARAGDSSAVPEDVAHRATGIPAYRLRRRATVVVRQRRARGTAVPGLSPAGGVRSDAVFRRDPRRVRVCSSSTRFRSSPIGSPSAPFRRWSASRSGWRLTNRCAPAGSTSIWTTFAAAPMQKWRR